jgi:BlaI family penicillinase repressor
MRNDHYGMTSDLYAKLSRLERRIMDAVYRFGEASVAAVVAALDAADTSESIRVTMSNLEKKGFLTHRREGKHNLYRPTVPEAEVRRSLMDRVLRTFYEGRPTSAILQLLERGDTGLSAEDVAEIRARILRAEQGGSTQGPKGGAEQ